jgi:Asp/Glu/hydantoin racemase
MKIWLQSASSAGKDPTFGLYEKSLIEHAQKVARPDTTVDVYGVPVMARGYVHSRYIQSLNNLQITDNAIKAEKEGYDAFGLTCMLDPVFIDLREVVDIPIVSPLEVSCHIACLLAPKFAIVGFNEYAQRQLAETVKRYGLEERFVPSGAFDMNIEDVAYGGFKDPGPLLQKFKKVAREAAERGADMLIPNYGCLAMVLVDHGITEVEGVPVLDVIGTVIKAAEFMVDLKNIGVERVNRGFYGRLPKDELAAIRELYSVDRNDEELAGSILDAKSPANGGCAG